MDNAFLDDLYGTQSISQVLYHVKSGKEADVYCCEAQPYVGVELVAAKVYRPLASRGFRNDAIYQQGRFIKDARLRRAYANRSRAGRTTQFDLWVTAEWETMAALHAAGALVPKPLERASNVIVMEFFGTRDQPAPTLNRIRLPEAEAKTIADQITEQIDLWLSCVRIHGDLSSYNILYDRGKITLIDFPQAVDSQQNASAFDLLLRDLGNIGY